MLSHICDSCGKTMIKFGTVNISTGDKLYYCQKCVDRLIEKKARVEQAYEARIQMEEKEDKNYKVGGVNDEK